MNLLCSSEPCPVLLDSACVFYTGGNLLYTGIVTNDNLQTALEKIDSKFQNAAIGYVFQNGLVQTIPGNVVKLGGPLIQNTTITSSGYTLTVTEDLIAGAHITTGGTSSEFVKGDGSLDNTSYQVSGNYITGLSGDGTASGPGVAAFTLSNVNAFPGVYGGASTVPVVTVNAKGLVTSVTNTPINFPPGSLVFTGDVTGIGTTGTNTALTLLTVNPNTYLSNTFLKFAVNGKGLVTSAAPITNLDIIGVLGYTPVPDTRTITINGVTQNLANNRTWTIGTTWGSITGVLSSQTDLITYLSSTYTPKSRTLTINGTTYDLSADRSWTIAAGVSSVTASSPLASSGGSTPNITIQQASGSQAGYLSSTDWTTFNSKQNALTLTTTGTSGAATLIGSTLNIPQYSGGGGSGTVTSVQLSAGTGISLSGTNPITTSGTITVTNSAPDQTVVLSSGTGISTSGTYPNFTITNTSPDQTVTLTDGTGITTSGTYPNFTITNSAPDQVVSLGTTGSGLSVTGTYPSFTLQNTLPDQTVAISNGTGISVTGTYPSFTVTNTSPDQTVSLTQGTGITITGTYPNFTITNASPSSGGTVTSVSAGTGMNFTTITGSGSVSIDSTKVPYLSGGFSTGLLKWNGSSWTFDNSTYLTTAITSLNGLTGTTQTFSNDTNVTIVSSGTTHTITWSGTLADSRIASASTWNSKIGGSGTTNEIAYFTASGTIGSLATATYPSLTELSYVKGVTSAVQTQLNGKLGTSLTSANIFVGNGSNIATGVAMSGDATIANTGALTIANSAVTLAKMANLAANSIIGNNTASPATPLALTGTQVTAMLDLFSTSATTKGLVPGSNSVGNTYFLRADGTWAVPAGGGGGGVSVGDAIAYAIALG